MRNRTSFCGVYWRNGFHEDGLWSGLAVAAAIDAARLSPKKSAVRQPTFNSRYYGAGENNMSLASCIYEGDIRHRRFAARIHFSYRLFLLYVDLEELATLFDRRWFWSVERFNLASFRRADHHGAAEQPLNDSIRDLVECQTGMRPDGPIRLLTHFRYANCGMNPISLYYCFDRTERLQHVVAEVNNTPWGEQHCYLLDAQSAVHMGKIHRWQIPKQFHVSPFFDMQFDYEFRVSEPGRNLGVSIKSYRRGEGGNGLDAGPTFDALLRLRRRLLTGAELARALLRFPLLNAQIVARIYWQAFRLWAKGVPFVPHPTTNANTHSIAAHTASRVAHQQTGHFHETSSSSAASGTVTA